MKHHDTWAWAFCTNLCLKNYKITMNLSVGCCHTTHTIVVSSVLCSFSSTGFLFEIESGAGLTS